jgi:starch synthase
MKSRETGQQKINAPSSSLRILMVASECAPFAKLGGLADVVAGLSKALRRQGHDARVVLPLYADIDRGTHGIQFCGSSCIHMGGGIEHWVGIHECRMDNEVPVWFVDYESYFGRPGIYDGPQGHYRDNGYRFALLSKAAIQICKDRQFVPDVMHLHDWPSALAAVFLKTWDWILSPLSNTASVLTIHNIGHQGIYDPEVFPYIGITPDHFTPDRIEDHGKVNMLKAGIAYADALTTVSPTHAREILTPEGGKGLAPYLNNRQGDLFGIINGADYEYWNPEIDSHIPSRYDARDLSGKAVCKTALQRQFNLETCDLPVFGVVSRFAVQKGFSLVREALPAAMKQMDFQVAALGNGDPEIENFFRWLQSTNPGRAGVYIGFSNELSHLIEAGSDFFLMPSLYEPCGLNQIYSLKYGTLPIVRAAGGLDDTVQNYNEATGNGTGFKFWAPTSAALLDTIGWAVSTWYDRPHHISRLRRQAMAQNYDWNNSAPQYVEVYKHALQSRHRSPDRRYQ